MSVTVEFTIPAADVALGQVFEDVPSARIELERTSR